MTCRRFSITVGLLALIVATCFASDPAAKSRVDAPAAFERLKSLAGEWEAETSQGRTQNSYQVIAAGSVVLELEKFPGGMEMATTYHLDGDRLLLTHYCMAKNQPRMVATRFDPVSGQIDFDFLDATGLSRPEAGHMHAVKIQLLDADHFKSNWQFFEGGKPKFSEDAQFTRKR